MKYFLLFIFLNLFTSSFSQTNFDTSYGFLKKDLIISTKHSNDSKKLTVYIGNDSITTILLSKKDSTFKDLLKNKAIKDSIFLYLNNLGKDSGYIIRELSVLYLNKLLNIKLSSIRVKDAETPDANKQGKEPQIESTYDLFLIYLKKLIVYIVALFMLVTLIATIYLIYVLPKYLKLKSENKVLIKETAIESLIEKYNLPTVKNKDNLTNYLEVLSSSFKKIKDDLDISIKKEKERDNDILLLNKEKSKFINAANTLTEENKINTAKLKERDELIITLNESIEIQLKLIKDTEANNSEILNLSTIFIDIINKKSATIQSLASSQNMAEADKMMIQTLIFATFHSLSLLKKSIKKSMESDSYNIDLLKGIESSSVTEISKNIQYDRVPHLVYFILRLLDKYDIKQLDDVYLFGFKIKDN